MRSLLPGTVVGLLLLAGPGPLAGQLPTISGFSGGISAKGAQPSQVVVTGERRFRRSVSVGPKYTRNLDTDANSFGFELDFVAAVLADGASLLTTLRADRTGLPFGSQLMGTLAAGVSVEPTEGLAFTGQIGVFRDRVKIDLGSGSVTNSGNGSMLLAAIEKRVVERVRAKLSVERRSTPGARVAAGFGLKYRF